MQLKIVFAQIKVAKTSLGGWGGEGGGGSFLLLAYTFFNGVICVSYLLLTCPEICKMFYFHFRGKKIVQL